MFKCESCDKIPVFGRPESKIAVRCGEHRKNGDIYKDLRLTMKDGKIAPQRSCRMLGLYLTYNLRQDWYISQMKGNLISFLNNSIKARALFKRDKDYVVMNGEPVALPMKPLNALTSPLML